MCSWSQSWSWNPHCCPGARDLTVVWGVTGGGGSPLGLTRNLGGDLAQLRRPGHGIQRPTPRRPPWVSHDGTGRAPPGGGGMQVNPGSPCGPALSRACVSPPTVLPSTTPGHGWEPHTRTPGQVWGSNTMAFGQGSDVTGDYRSCPAMQCGTTVTSGLTTIYPVTSQPRWVVSLWPSPSQGSLPFPAPQPRTPCVSAQVHHGMVAVREDMGDDGVKGSQRRGWGKGQNLPLRCSLRRGAGTYLSLQSWLPMN